ncbi:Na+/H+ antiporter subunit D [Fusibacter sp. A1]|nr:Na+/H+ antiporter subunit E [Fusibacter sp. A1]RXV61157.1 Na+/H+ antiporter subunit D [Fusibacter sp. A1]
MGLFIICFVVWVLLAGFSYQEVLLGAVVSAVISLLYGKTSSFDFSFKWIMGFVLFIVMYVPLFLLELIKANIDVLLRVLSPKLPINPGFVKVPTTLKGDFANLTLANSITLTPGTITLDADEDYLYVHWIDVKSRDGQVDVSSISDSMQNVLRRVFK